jgi:AraC-like DNA-binding protein
VRAISAGYEPLAQSSELVLHQAMQRRPVSNARPSAAASSSRRSAASAAKLVRQSSALAPSVPTELVQLTLRHATRPGIAATAIPALQIVRADSARARTHTVLRPSLCFLVQGTKESTVGSEVFRYRSSEFLFASVELPITGEVIEASPGAPYLCLALEIDPSVVFELASASAGFLASPTGAAKRAIFVGEGDELMTHAFLRLMKCLERRADAEVLAPIVIREITYRLLLGRYGDAVRELVIVGSQTQRVAKAIDRLKRDYATPLSIEELAGVAGMSVSSFHEHFKKVTALSPLQYQKQLRLQEARRLLLGDSGGAADVGFRVGYESPSQFSREYARFFGLPPASDLKRQRALPG